MAVILLFVGLTPVFSQSTIATFGFGYKDLNGNNNANNNDLNNYNDDYNNNYNNETLMAVNFLFVRPSGLTFSVGFDKNVKIDPLLGLGYVHYNKYYIGGILNISPKSDNLINIFLIPTLVFGYNFGQFSLGGQLSYMLGMIEPISGFRYFLGAGICIGNFTDYNDTQSTQAEAETETETSPVKETNNKYFSGFYIETTIPPFLKQIWNDAPFPFGGGITYMDFGLGVALFNNIFKAQINYGFITQALYESMGGVGYLIYSGNVFGLKFFVGPEINLRRIFGSSWDRISASFGVGLNFSLLEGYTQSDGSAWRSSFVAQLEFPKVTFTDRKIFKGFSLFTEGQLWYYKSPFFRDERVLMQATIVMGLRLYIF
jgi:hypothetical protein